MAVPGRLATARDAWVPATGCGRGLDRLPEVFARHSLRPEVSVPGPKVFAVAGQSPRASQTSHR